MNSKIIVMRGRMMQLVAAFGLVMVMSGVASAWNISATSITVPSDKHGRMYFTVMDQNNNAVAGGSLPEGAASGTIRGVPSGSYMLKAFVDTTGTGFQHANDPAFSNPIVVSSSGGEPAVFTTPAPVATAAPDPTQGNFNVMPLGSAAFVNFRVDKNNNLPTADRHTIYWSTSSNPGPSQPDGTGGSLVVTSKDPKVVIYNLTNDTQYWFAVRAENNVNSALSTPVGPIVPATPTVSASTVNVPVDSTGIAKSSSTPLIVVVTDNKNSFYMNYVMAPTDVQIVPVTGVQAGTYLMYTILDLSGTGNIDDPRNVSNMSGADRNQRPLPIVVDGLSATIKAPTTKLAIKNAGVAVSTNHSLQNGLENYSLWFNVAPMSKQLVNVTLENGPQINGPIDLGKNSNNDGNGSYGLSLQIPNRPAVGATYNFSLYYVDAPLTAVPGSATVTAVIDNFPNNTFPVGATGPGSVSPTFSWTNPGNLPGFVVTSLSLNNNGVDFLPMNVLTATVEGASFPVGQMSSWDRSIQDLDGNQARQSMSFTPNASGPVVSDFSPKSGPGGSTGTSVTITGSGFDPVLANYANNSFPGRPSSVRFNGALATVTAASTTSLTVTAPASSGVVTVSVGGVTAGSSAAFAATTTFSGSAQDNAGANLSGVTIALAENPTVSIGSSNTNATGSDNFTNRPVPARPYYSVLFSKSSYYPTYTALMSTSPGSTNSGSWSVFTSGDLFGRSVLPPSGKGVIIGRVVDFTNAVGSNYLTGAVVTATSTIHPDVPYVVKYTNGTTVAQDPLAITQTDSNGRFYVIDVDEGDYVTVTASKAGMGFQNRVFNTHGDSVSNQSVRGATPGGPPSATPLGGAYATPLDVSLSIPVEDTTDDIFYTTDGSDPTVFGKAYSTPIAIAADTTLKFATKNRNVGQAFGPVQTEVYSIGISISGKVTDATTSSPLSFVGVQLSDVNNVYIKQVSTDNSGNYKISGLTAGTYKVCFYTGQGYISQCWQDTVGSPASATPIVVSTNPITGINAALQAGATISGRVTSNGSSGIQNVWVNLFDTNGIQVQGLGGATTDANGDYSLGGIPAGTYKIYFNGQNNNTGYIGQWYINKADAASADPIAVIAGATYPGINAQLTQGGSISGRVTRIGSIGIQNVNVQLRDTSGFGITGVNGAMTIADGTYTITGIPPGIYKLYFDASSTSYIGQWFSGATDQSLATPLTVIAGGSLTGNDAVLASGGIITGKITSNGTNGIQNVNVQVRDTNGFWIPGINGTFTDASGNYSLGGLPSGSYKLYFDGNSTGYISKWFDNVADQSFASTIVVFAGFTYPGYNAQLAQGANISGTVTNSGLAGIQNVSVQLYKSGDTYPFANTNTNVSGGYQFSGLPAGTYKVCFSPGQTNYIPKCYDNLAYDSNASTGIPITVPGGRNDINATMTLGGGISGQVTNGSIGIQNIFIEVRDTVTGNTLPGVFSMWTNSGGNYTVQGIPAGGIKVYFNADNTIYGGQWYNSKTSFVTSDSVSISPGLTSALSTAVLQSATAPGAPTITSITPGFGQAQVYFNAPASDGGRQIRDYTVTFNPGGLTGFGINSPINVPNLTNGQNYTVSVTARNDIGSSTAASTTYALPYFVPPGNDLQAIVDAIAAGGAAWTQSGTAILSNLALLITKGITVSGGYNSSYNTVAGYTIVPGTTTGLRPGGIIIRGNNFKVIFKNVKVKAP